MSRSQKAQSRRQGSAKSDAWKNAKPATGGPRLSEIVSPVPYSLQDKNVRKHTASFDVSTKLLKRTTKAYRNRFPGERDTGKHVIHEALKAYCKELEFQARLMDRLGADLSE